MLGTVLSILLAIGLWFFEELVTINQIFLGSISVALGIIFFLLYSLTTLFIFSPLQKVEQNLTPRLVELFSRDSQNHLIGLWVVFFTFVSIALGIAGFTIGGISPAILVMFWVVSFGITFDLYRHFVKRLLGYLNPYVIIELFTKRAQFAIQNENEEDLCNYIDALAEVGMKSLSRSSTSLCLDAIDEQQQIARIFLESIKSVGHHNSEQVSFILFYIFQRLEMISAKAIELKLEPVASSLVTATAKIALYAARCDMSLVSFPLHYLGKFAGKSQTMGLEEVGVRGLCALSEVGREIVEKVDLSYAEIQDPYFTLIGQLENLSKEMFRQNKKISFKIINQPFLDLKELFSQEKMASHQDTPIIQKDLDRVLEEFANLEIVMRTIPPTVKAQQ